MDLALDSRVALDELKRTAPRSFDKIVCDLIAKVQEGQRPIIVPAAQPAPAVHTTTVVERETLPEKAAALITDMAQTIVDQNLRLIDLEARLSAIEAIEIDKTLLRGAA